MKSIDKRMKSIDKRMKSIDKRMKSIDKKNIFKDNLTIDCLFLFC